MVEASRAGSFISSTLTLIEPSFKAEWQITKPGLDRSTRIDALTTDDVGLPRGTQFPVTVKLVVDGQVAWRREYSAPGLNVVDTEAMISAKIPPCDWLSFRRPGIAVEIGAAALTTFWGAQTAQFISTAGDVMIAVKPLELPDWAALAKFTAETFVSLEADRVQGRCQPRREIMISERRIKTTSSVASN